MKKPFAFCLKIFVLIFILSFSFTARAQWYNPEKVNKKAGDIYASAYEQAKDMQYEKALKTLNEALKIEPRFVDVFLSRAGIYAEMKNYNSSVKDFETAFTMDSMYSSTYLLPYSISLAGIGNFSKALEKVNHFLATPKLNSQWIIQRAWQFPHNNLLVNNLKSLLPLIFSFKIFITKTIIYDYCS